MKTIFFGKITMQMSHFWKIYHVNDLLLLLFNGIIYMEIDANGKFPCLYGYAYR
jgi:hypothetical protein